MMMDMEGEDVHDIFFHSGDDFFDGRFAAEAVAENMRVS